MLKQAQPDADNYVSPLSQVPYAVLVTADATPARIADTLRLEYSTLKMQAIYRYLQIWKDRCWIRHAIGTPCWILTEMGATLLERQIVDRGWPRWLTKHGIKQQEFVIPPDPKITS